MRSVVVTFDRHPMEVVRPGSQPKYLQSLDRKIESLLAQRLDLIYVVTFDLAFSQQSADEFIFYSQLLTTEREEEEERPYTCGTMRIVPALDPKFKKSGERQGIVWIYGVGQASNNKPDVQVEYNFHQKTAEGEKYFNKTAPQLLNASTLPPQFDVAAGLHRNAR